MVEINKLDYLAICSRTMRMMRGCKNEGQLGVAHRYAQLFYAHIKRNNTPRYTLVAMQSRLEKVYKECKEKLC